MFNNFFKKKKILVTGHTGFKGSWLTFWLNFLGAKVVGISLEKTKLSNALNSTKNLKNYYFDIKNIKKLKAIINETKPDLIFHLAAQAIVAKSYKYPMSTWVTNNVGMLNLMETLRTVKKKCSVILITSDKVYKNVEQKKGYKETDILQGVDPYSASKSCADILAQSYIKSVLNNKKNLNFGIARAGNVIGGGDFSDNRIVPDLIKSVNQKKQLILRQPLSTRPWQHVIEIIFGYLIFSKYLFSKNNNLCEILNFGPIHHNNFKVIDVVNEAQKYIKLNYKIISKKKKFKESILLKLNSSKAYKTLAWKSILNFNETMKYTMEWYQKYPKYSNDQIKLFTQKQIVRYYNKTNNK